MKDAAAELNTVYISERVRESLRQIPRCALTAVIAPMGYGKTTAVSWFLAGQVKAQRAVVVRVNIYSDSLPIFWKSAQNAFAAAGMPFLADCSMPADPTEAGMLTDELCRAFPENVPCYLFLDDFHLLRSEAVETYLCDLAKLLPENVHIIVASRDEFPKSGDVVRLGARLHRIGKEQLRLNHTELSVYAERCGLALDDADTDALLRMSEGWFSAIYFALRSYVDNGSFPDGERDIHETFTAVMLDPLSEDKREFLTVMGLADEFTAEMADFVIDVKDVAPMLSALTRQNSFITRVPGGETYRFHHIMKDCAAKAFAALDEAKRSAYLERYGRWYEQHGEYIRALDAYERGGSYDAALAVIGRDAGILLASIGPERVLATLAKCSDDVLKRHPAALLVLMRRMFTWRQIPVMMHLKELLESAVEQDPDMTDEERGNLLGERDLILSFLMYNDIKKMSALHRSAAAQMSRPAVSLRNEGSWTFGSPSVLMMFYRAPGELDEELSAMDECMPYYYRLTNGHGEGAEKIMEAEAAFMQGRCDDAAIALERARSRIAQRGQINMELCCDFLACRLALCRREREYVDPRAKRARLLRLHNAMWLNINDFTCAYYYALISRCEDVPELFREHRLEELNLLAPCKPMVELIENQVYLAQGAYARIIGRSGQLLALCDAMHYALVALHIRIQTAAAYEMMGKRAQARELLAQALRDAAPDSLLMPFVENYAYLSEPLKDMDAPETAELVGRILRAGDEYLKTSTGCAAPEFSALNEKELKIVRLVAAYCSNKEIAERLSLSEGTVKQYINRIYNKLSLTGDSRTKRRLLAEIARLLK